MKTITVITYGGRRTIYPDAELQHMVDNPDLYYCADSLPKWLAIKFMALTDMHLPTFECAYHEAIKVIKAIIASDYSTTINVRSDRPYKEK